MTLLHKDLGKIFLVGTFLSVSSMCANAVTIAVTGYNSDIIAEAGNDPITTATNGGVIGSQQWVMAATGYTGAGVLPGTPLVISSNTVTTQNGTVFSVNAAANNALVNDGTLTFVSPRQYQSLQFLLFMVSGNFTATVNFADTSTTVLSQTAISDWQGSNTFNAFAAPNSAAEISSVRRLTGQLITLNPRELSFTLSSADQAKTINSITFDFSSNDRSSVFGISGTVPEPSSLLLLSFAGLLCFQRRRV